ncbi:hypothetical protein QR680_009947 [Steinernema hermaphroditum]|uniref:P/Homo B domain-containing protein n=1 Tax=Steinernema hermaphroditum TaxID=289476 RepID=A0AA39IP42_9BILA|nr:hypothetical protein QR680_009947 [Steinernema hermaphroditum]
MIVAKFVFWLSVILAVVEASPNPSISLQSLDRELDDLLAQLLKIRNRLKEVKSQEGPTQYTNEWVVEIFGGPKVASNVAQVSGYSFEGAVRGFNDLYKFRRRRRTKRAAEGLTRRLRSLPAVKWVEQQRIRRRAKRTVTNMQFNDPLWDKQWQLHERRDNSSGQVVGMNIQEAWTRGYTGKGVVVSILDDGIEHTHTDLKENYDPEASYDLNDDDFDPTPTNDEYNKHGTRCAGEVVMAANNSKCGVGVAFGAKVGGIRMLDGKITDRIESEALSYRLDHIDIYSASWGPNDDGKTVEGPGTLAASAIRKGIEQGRGGKGAIYVWASGNGGINDDDCNCDGYTDSIHTFSVSSAAEDGTFPWYGEKCASTLTTTYSTGSNKSRMVMTTDLNDQCATDHSGTSASAPIAAGIIALGLEANPNLTWRDVQHIAVWTSAPEPLVANNDGWHMNGAGFYVNSKFGFGMMNALAFVSAAEKWATVPQQRVCTTVFPKFRKRSVNNQIGATVQFKTDGCKGQDNEINFIEHVQLVVDIEHELRGHLAIWLVSPSKTRTQLLSVRREDTSPAGFRHWPFMSVHNWGERPQGVWELQVEDLSGLITSSGVLNNLSLVIYGTKEQPAHYSQPRNYTVTVSPLERYKTRRQAADQRTLMMNRGKRIIENKGAGASGAELDRIVRTLDIQRQMRRKRSTNEAYVVDDFVAK